MCDSQLDMKTRIPSRAFLNPLFGTFQKTQPNVAFSQQAWTCRRCLQQRQQSAIRIISQTSRANYASISQGVSGGGKQNGGPGQERQSGTNGKKRSRRSLKYAAAGGTLTAAALIFSDDVKHAYSAMERTGRVVSALAVCINE